MPQRLAKSSVFLEYDDSAFLCAETPSEVAELVELCLDGGHAFVQLTAGNESEWNGKPIFIHAASIRGIVPPLSQRAMTIDTEE